MSTSCRRSPLFLALVIYGVLALAFCLCLFTVPGERILAGRLPAMGGDFLALSIGGSIVADGQGAHLYDLGSQSRAQVAVLAAAGTPLAEEPAPENLALFVYPPFVALAFATLAGLPPLTAYLLWAAVNLTLLTLALVALARAAGLTSTGQRLLLALLALSFLPTWMVLVRGQVSFLILSLLLACYLALRTRREFLAGLCLALACTKPQLAVIPILALLFAQRWRALGGCALGAGVLAILSVLVAGSAGVGQYLALLTQVGSETGADSLVHPVYMFNWRGTAVRLADLLCGPGTPGGQSLALAIYLALALASLAVLWAAWRGPWAATGKRLAGLWALTIVLGMLASPHLHEYDQVLWLLAGLLTVAHLAQTSVRPVFWLGLLLCLHALPLLTLALDQTLRAQVGVMGSLALTAGLCVVMAREPRMAIWNGLQSLRRSGAGS